MKRMSVLGVRVRVTDRDHEVLVVLCEAAGSLSLPIVIGPHEGIAIATAQAGVQAPRPGPHDLLLAVVDAAGARVEQVSLTRLHDGVFYAELALSNGKRVDSRASDAIAVALRAGVDLVCADEVLDQAGIMLENGPDPDELDVEISRVPTSGDEQDVAQFREFLDSVDPADFEGPSRPGPASP